MSGAAGQPSPLVTVAGEERLALVTLTRPPANLIDEALADEVVADEVVADEVVADEVVAAEDLLTRALQWGRAVSVSGSAAAVGRPLFYRSREQDYLEALEAAGRAFARAFTPD